MPRPIPFLKQLFPRSTMIPDTWHQLKKSLSIWSCSLSPVFVFYFLDHLDLFSSLPNFQYKFFLIVVQFIALFIAKILVVAASIEAIALLIKGEEDLFSKKVFRSGIRRHTFFVAAISVIPAVIHLLIYLLSGQFLLFESVTIFLNVPLLLILAFIVLRNNSQGNLTPPNLFQTLFIVLGYLVSMLIAFIGMARLPEIAYLNSTLIFFAVMLDWWVLVFTLCVLGEGQLCKLSPKRHLILVNPPFSGTAQSLGSMLLGLYPPVFIVIRALTPAHYKIHAFNRVLWHDIYYQSGALVAITCMTANSSEAYKLAKEFKRRGSKVIMGGPHVSIFPDEALEFCDSVVIGPVESVWDDVIRDYENNSLHPYYERTPQEPDLQRTRAFLQEQDPEVIAGFLETRRGCKFKCYFCANPALQKGLDSCSFKLEDMIGLIKKVATKYKYINFIDTNIYSDPAYAKGLLEAMVPLKIRWNGSATIDIATDAEMLDLLKKSGCAGLLIGYEIPEGSKDIDKGGKLVLVKRYVELTQKLKKAGVQVKAHFIYGFERDNLASLCKLWFFCLKLWPHTTVISFLTPIPGSAFFKEMLSLDRIKNINWRNYNLHTLVYENPVLDNWVFRKAFLWVLVLFLGTTSSMGIALLVISFCVIYFSRMLGI